MHRIVARCCRAATAVALASLAACGDDSDRTETNYCTQVDDHLAELNSPVIATDDDVDRVVDAWRSVAAAAPLAVEPEWEVMVDNIETAVTVDPNDPDSMQLVADTARRSEQAANRVISYTQQICGVLIGDVAPTATTIATETTATTGTTTSAAP
jgi:hypothetical protein